MLTTSDLAEWRKYKGNKSDLYENMKYLKVKKVFNSRRDNMINEINQSRE